MSKGSFDAGGKPHFNKPCYTAFGPSGHCSAPVRDGSAVVGPGKDGITPVAPRSPKDDVMPNPTVSQIYAVGAVVLLAAVVLLNRPAVTIIASAVGLAAGALVLRRGGVQRVTMVAVAGFAAAIVIAAVGLLPVRPEGRRGPILHGAPSLQRARASPHRCIPGRRPPAGRAPGA